MSFDYTQIDLPVGEIIPEVKSNLANSSTLIVKAPTGAGKSTLLPIALLDEPWLEGKKIYMLEPRRLAAKAVASRMAELLGEKLGQTVGYRVRFEKQVGKDTRLEVLTEGILTRMIHEDNALEDVGMIIFDEFHERSIHADIAMALSRETQKVLREDLRLLIMSATIDMPQLSKMLDDAPILESKGRMFPVDVHYAGEADVRMLPELAAHTVKFALKNHAGDVLVFLPGQAEIMKCAGLLRGCGAEVHPLFGMLNFQKQQQAIFPNKDGKRKVVIATNIAETSLTIEGIKVVVDCGFERKARFNQSSGLTKLETVRISRESSDQRKGRAGRLSEGVCYRMWTKAVHEKMQETGTPEIELADLTSLLLDMAEWGIDNPLELAWVTPPPVKSTEEARSLLHELDALEDGKITKHGKAMHKLPTHPRIAHMLLKAQEEGVEALALATDIAPLLEEKDPLSPEVGIDINKRIEFLRRKRKENNLGGKIARIEKLAQQYRSLFDLEPNNGSVNEFQTGVLLAYCYPERIACARPGNNAQFQLANGRIAMAGHRDDLANEQWLSVAQVAERDNNRSKIFMASPLNPKDLKPLLKRKEVVKWDKKAGLLKSSIDLGIGSIVLYSENVKDPDPEKVVKVICQVLKKDGSHLLDWNDRITNWQNRVATVKEWTKKENYPDVSMEKLLETCENWLSPYLSSVKTADDLKSLNLFEILQYSLPQDLQLELDQLAPEKVSVPSGSNVTIMYQSDASVPVLPVRLQECFGMLQTPSVNNGQLKVLMHLLSPGYKLVQITGDIESFWKDAYFDVRKDLRIKYKKHSWPENPLEAEALKGAKKRK